MVSRPDWRLWLPAIVASLCFATRALPKATTEKAPESRSISLPQLYGMQSKPRLQRFQLRPEDSSVRFHVTGRRHQTVTDCRQMSGELQLGPKPDEGTLTLRLDLASLQSLAGEAPGIRIPDVLGVLGNVELVYHGKMVAATSSDLPGITQTTWLGRIHFGSKVLAQPMQLWRCALPGHALRLQGHGLAATGSLGLPSRATMGFLTEHYTITLGLDLAWRPVRD
jgi:hypothetical protein